MRDDVEVRGLSEVAYFNALRETREAGHTEGAREERTRIVAILQNARLDARAGGEDTSRWLEVIGLADLDVKPPADTAPTASGPNLKCADCGLGQCQEHMPTASADPDADGYEDAPIRCGGVVARPETPMHRCLSCNLRLGDSIRVCPKCQAEQPPTNRKELLRAFAQESQDLDTEMRRREQDGRALHEIGACGVPYPWDKVLVGHQWDDQRHATALLARGRTKWEADLLSEAVIGRAILTYIGAQVPGWHLDMARHIIAHVKNAATARPEGAP